MESKFIWQIGEDWSITKVSKENNKLFANAKATAVYAVIGNSQMLETDTVEMTCEINGNSYHKKLQYYPAASGEIAVDGNAVGGWEVVSNGEELAFELDSYEVITISFNIKRFSSIDGTTLMKNQPTGETTENVYPGNAYTPMVEPSDAEDIIHLIDELNARKQDKVDNDLITENKTIVGAINELKEMSIVSKGVLPYDAEFAYPIDTQVYDETTHAIYKSLIDNNLGNALSNTLAWSKIAETIGVIKNNVRITDLTPGIYRCLAPFTFSIYYNGAEGSDVLNVATGGYLIIQTNTDGLTPYISWRYNVNTGRILDNATITSYIGLTTTSSGTYNQIALNDTAQVNLLARKYAVFGTYNIADYAIVEQNHAYKLYRCKENGVTGEFDPTKWDEVTVAQALSYKQDVLTFDTAPTQNSTNPVTSGGLFNEFENIREQAEGKTGSYVIRYSTSGNQMFNSQNDSISLDTELIIEDVDGHSIWLKDLKKGDIIWVVETEVPDRWVGSIESGVITFYKLETSKIDLSNYVNKTTNENVAGVKTFTDGIVTKEFEVKFDDNNKVQIQVLSNGKTRLVHYENASSYMVELPQWAGVVACINQIFPTYNSTMLYKVGDLVSYNSYFYRCNTPITTPEAFDITKWTPTILVEVLNNKQDKLTAGTNITIDANNVISASGGTIAPASKTNLGGVYMFEDADSFQIWNKDPQNTTPTIETNPDGSLSYKFNTLNYRETTNTDGSTNYIIGGNE